MRKHVLHPSQDDPDRTDELPQLDPAAYEAQLKAMESTGLDSTDTWLAPQPQDLHGARIGQLEAELKDREAELHALKGDLELTSSTKSRLDGELNGILSRISQLETHLAEAVESNAALDANNRQVAGERDDLALRCEQLDTALKKITAVRDGLDARTSELQRELSAERTAAATKVAELESQAAQQTLASSSAQVDAGTLRSQLDQSEASVAAANERIASLDHDLAEQTRAAAAIAQRFSEQYSLSNSLHSALNTTHAAIARLEQALALREAAIAALERTEEALSREQATTAGLRKGLELRALADEDAATALRTREQALAAAEATAGRLHGELSTLQQEFAATRSELAVRSKSLTATEAALEQAASDHGAALAREAGLQAELEDLRSSHARSVSESSLQAAELADQRERLGALASQSAALEQLIVERDALVRSLESEAAARRVQLDGISTELDAARAGSQSLANELHSREAAVIALRAELAAHVEALGAIRRDINRIESGQAIAAPSPSLRYLIGVDNTDVVHVLNRKVMTIGRTHESDLQIRSSHISRHHARLLIGASAVIIEDLGSTNGCYVNGRRVRKQILQNEDVLMIGKTRYRFSARPQGDPASH
jgi:chromosome segregation ATPase